MFLAMPGGGVWRSADFQSAAPTWIPLTDHLPGIDDTDRVGLNVVSTLAVDPQKPQRIYARAGMASPALLRSSDGGSTWSLVGQQKFGGATGIWRVLADPLGNVYAAFNSGGFWQSTDGGGTWTDVASNALNGVEFHDAVYFVDKGGTLAIYTGVIDRQGQGRSGVWSFINGQWFQMAMTLTNMRGQAFSPNVINHITMSADPVAGVCASLSQGDDGNKKVGLLNIFKLWNGIWDPWWFSQTDWFITQGGYVQGVCIAPDGRLYGGGIGLAQSSGDHSFVAIGTDVKGHSIHVDQHVIVAYGGLIYVGTDGGLFRFQPRANLPGVDLWESLNTTSLTNYLATGGAAHPTNSAVLLVGSQDNGIARRSGNGQWAHSDFSNEREKLRFDPDLKNQGIYAFSGDPNNGFYWSKDAGVSFQGFGPQGVPAPDPPPPFAFHPTNSARLLIGWMTAYETPDRGQTWTKGPTLQTSPTAVTYAGGNAAYIGAGSQLFQTFDAGQTWTQDPFNFPASIVSLCPDISNSAAIYVATNQNVFRRMTPQVGWEDVSGNLPLSINVMTLLTKGAGLDPWLFVGTDAGVFVASHLQSANTWWTRYGGGLPDTSIQDLQLTLSTGLILAATYGRGCWATVIGPEPPGVRVKVRGGVGCGSGPVAGGVTTVDADASSLVQPLTYKWTAVNTTIVGKDNGSSVKVNSPILGTTAIVSVTVTDAEGAIVHGSVSFASISPGIAYLRELMCHLKLNFPIDPLWDPLRDFPIDDFSRHDLELIHGIASEIVLASKSLLGVQNREGEQSIGAPARVATGVRRKGQRGPTAIVEGDKEQ
jgi:hypothetical protein